jgi:hypothetical protein
VKITGKVNPALALESRQKKLYICLIFNHLQVQLQTNAEVCLESPDSGKGSGKIKQTYNPLLKA